MLEWIVGMVPFWDFYLAILALIVVVPVWIWLKRKVDKDDKEREKRRMQKLEQLLTDDFVEFMDKLDRRKLDNK